MHCLLRRLLQHPLQNQKLLTEDLLLPTEEDTVLTTNLKTKMKEVLEEKYSVPASQQLLAKASFIDPG